ncbi:MAG: ADP-heptose--LPS heptosyltransferase 2 [Candidatus Anoxychlamydiales bacterium]|nr:ADP-heptose--LPS heptosyltransferase 2 [Candidatus Anoxychlamydiales bacterium]NGX36530.1 ADP-heptose--LPS heptosyltransferase 2 [Candidatus Anoxychlamydiales bacterium]
MLNGEPKNIIVRMPNWVGDLVMATPVLYDLKQKFPEASITAMAKEPLCSLLKKDKNINELFCFKKQKNIFLRRRENKNIIENLREGLYDLGVLLTNSFSSAWLFSQGKVKNTIGYKKDFRALLLDTSMPFSREKEHLVIKYKQLLKPLGIENTKSRPKLYLDDKEIKQTKELLYQRGFSDGNTLIGINPLAQYGSAKCWPLDRFKEVAIRLTQDENNRVVFLGDNSSKDIIKKLFSDMPKNIINLSGRTTLRELSCIIHECDLFLTNDSGPMHIAAAFDIPELALFGSTTQNLTGPYSEKAHIINKNVKCSPCFKRTCPIDFKCMQEIQVDEVMDQLLKILKNA